MKLPYGHLNPAIFPEDISIFVLMSGKNKILLTLSVALAIFFCLPWIAVNELRAGDLFARNGTSVFRIVYLFISVFLTSVLFFQYNFFWKHRILLVRSVITRQFLNLFLNGLLVCTASAIMVIMTSTVLAIGAGGAYFIFYLFRNTGIALVVILVTYVLELVEKSRQDKVAILTLQNQNSETALAALKAQIDPHFLFNTLTSLSGLIRSDTKEALEFVDHLSETFRYTLLNREQKLVAVRDELRFLESYIFMMKKRLAEGFQVTMNIKEAHLSMRIPQFALQTTVENTVKHNFTSTRNPLLVEIFSHGDMLMVRNNLQRKKPVQGFGVGLSNLSKRYQIISNKNIEIISNAHHFEIKLPLL